MPCSAVSQLTNAPAPQIPASWPTTPAQQSVFLQQLANVFAYARDAAGRQGVNVVPTAYAVYNGAQLPTLTVSGASTSLDTTRHQFGLASLKLTATGATVSVSFPSGAVPISAFQRWIASVYLFTSRTAIAGTLAVITANGTYSATITSSTALSEWYRLWGDMSLVGDAATSCTIQLTFTGCTAGDTFSLEGWQLEAASGNTNLPSPFANSAAPGSADFLPDGSAYVRLASSHSAGNVSYNYKGVWTSTTPYVTGDEVVYGQSYWLALNASTNSAPSTSSTNWQVVGSYSGFQGSWSSSTNYAQGAEVTYSGNYWIATQNNTNQAPTFGSAYWQAAGPSSMDSIPDGTSFVKLASSNASGNVAYNYKGVWSSATAYVTGDEVVYSNSYWLATTSSTAIQPQQGDQHWQIIGAYSQNQGAWSSSSTYYPGQEVNYAGNYWVCVTQNTNSAPSTSNTSWQIAGPDNLDAVTDGTTYARTYGSGLRNGHAAYTADSGGTIRIIKGVGDANTLSLDGEIADGTTYLRMPGANMDGNRRGLIDFTQGGHLGKSLANVPDDSGSSRYAVLAVDTNRRPLIDFTQTTHVGKVLDNIGDGTSYARILGSQLSSGAHKLTVAGSGTVLGDKRNLPQSAVNNISSYYSTNSLTWTATLSSGVYTGSINSAAFNAQYDGNSISYNASTVNLSSTGTGGTVQYWVYFDDPNHAGGTPALVATTTQSDCFASTGRVYLGSVSVLWPSGAGQNTGGYTLTGSKWSRTLMTAN